MEISRGTTRLHSRDSSTGGCDFLDFRFLNRHFKEGMVLQYYQHFLLGIIGIDRDHFEILRQ